MRDNPECLLTARGAKSVERLLGKSISDHGLSEKGLGLGYGGSSFSLGLREHMIKWREGQGFGADLYGQDMKNH